MEALAWVSGLEGLACAQMVRGKLSKNGTALCGVAVRDVKNSAHIGSSLIHLGMNHRIASRLMSYWVTGSHRFFHYFKVKTSSFSFQILLISYELIILSQVILNMVSHVEEVGKIFVQV